MSTPMSRETQSKKTIMFLSIKINDINQMVMRTEREREIERERERERENSSYSNCT
jgi:hypothetical protein